MSPLQWERFRRIFYTPRFVTLVNHTRHSVLSTLEVSERVWKARVLVVNERGDKKEEQVYEVGAQGNTTCSGGQLCPAAPGIGGLKAAGRGPHRGRRHTSRSRPVHARLPCLQFTMVQREGGWKDGYWFTLSVIPDADDLGSTIYGVI